MRRNIPWRGGFTLIEMNIVVALLLLVAAMVVPSVVAMRRSQRLRDLEAAIQRLPIQAANEARRSGLPVRLRVADGALVTERVPDQGDPETLRQVALNGDLEVEAAQRGSEGVDAGSWTWTVYPDGSSERGGLEFSEGRALHALVLSDDGHVQWVAGALPDPTPEKWPAGEIEQRG